MMRGVFLALSATAVWGLAACDTAPVPAESAAPAVTTAACEADPGKGNHGRGDGRHDDGHHDDGHHDGHHGAVAVAVACLQSCAHKVEQLAEIGDHHKPKHVDKKAGELADKQAKCARLFDALTSEQQQEARDLAGDAFTTCLGPDPCGEACDTLAETLNGLCGPLGMPDLCALLAGSAPLCTDAVCPVDAATCGGDCQAYGAAVGQACLDSLPNLGLCSLLAPVVASQCEQLVCPPPPPTCEQSCASEIDPELESCVMTGDPACFLALEAAAASCYGACCTAQCDAKLEAMVADCAPDDAECVAWAEGERAQCVAGCAYSPSTCGDMRCDWYEQYYCGPDCEPPHSCWDTCWMEYDEDWMLCETSADPEACWRQADFDRQLCEWECCTATCPAGEECCGPPPTPPVCGDELCHPPDELTTCPQDCEVELCGSSCFAAYSEAEQLCWAQPEPWACLQEAEGAVMLCQFGCCELGCGAPGCCGDPPPVPVCGNGACEGFEPEFCAADCPAEACWSDCEETFQTTRDSCYALPDPWECLQALENERALCQHGCCELTCGAPGCCGDPPPPQVCGNGVCEGYEREFCAADCQVEMCPQQCGQAFEQAVHLCEAEPDPQACVYEAEYQRILCEHGCCELGCGSPRCCGDPPPPPEICGDGVCGPGEQGWCEDCGPPVCGDGICGPGEEGVCEDCFFCGDGSCAPSEEGWCPDCFVGECGDGVCQPGEEGWCPDCLGGECGDGVCQPGEEGWCTDCGPFCGDGVCQPGEEGWCTDCGPFCGDGVCDPDEPGWCPDCDEPACGNHVCESGEEASCPADCSCGNGVCDEGEEGWCAECP